MKLTAIIQFLTFVTALLPLGTQDELAKGNISAQDAAVYIRKQVTAGGNTIKLIDGKTEEVVGLTNIAGNKLDDYRNLIIESISFKYATDATVTDAAAVSYITSDVPLALRNAELVLIQGNRTPINIPIMSLISGKNSSPSSVDGDRFKLMVWALIREGQKFDLNIELPEGAALGTGNHFVEVGLFGAQTALKASA
ncbi:hypothetical protein [Bizionia myxarmorum]|uniref:Uncharacterized protein n=1 Tax=Bizionia myxarmorum TaxID=291186 RepID=A0A5D0RB69_9FLAO|nr:hypothetical protein [Bizionia myxarmorum]TYB78329.1 hypothetical protein ES674_00685 [Bizionia myxarmorum]